MKNTIKDLFSVYNHYCLFMNVYSDIPGVTNVDFSRYPEREFQWDWLRIYLEEYNSDIEDYKVTERDVERLYIQVNKFAISASFLWGIWALVQAHVSNIDFDFME